MHGKTKKKKLLDCVCVTIDSLFTAYITPSIRIPTDCSVLPETRSHLHLYQTLTRCFYSKTNKMHQFLKFILFCSSILHVSDSLSVHHRESKTVHAASGICQTDSADCLLAGTRWNLRNWCISLVLL
jgi:hypothetical protein